MHAAVRAVAHPPARPRRCASAQTYPRARAHPRARATARTSNSMPVPTTAQASPAEPDEGGEARGPERAERAFGGERDGGDRGARDAPAMLLQTTGAAAPAG